MRELLKPTLLLFCAFCSFNNIYAQQVIAQNENISPIQNSRPATFEDYLVNLALTNSPEAEAAKYEIEAKKEEIVLAKKDWMRNVSGGFNINDISLPYAMVNYLGITKWGGEQIKTTEFVANPFWGINLGLNLYDIAGRKNKIKFAENKRKISEAELNFKKQKVKAEVLKRYQEFVVTFEILKIRLESLDAAEANKGQITEFFKANKATFTDFNEANKAYADAKENAVKGESEIKLKKIALEELLGVKWESVERVKANYEQQKR